MLVFRSRSLSILPDCIKASPSRTIPVSSTARATRRPIHVPSRPEAHTRPGAYIPHRRLGTARTIEATKLAKKTLDRVKEYQSVQGKNMSSAADHRPMEEAPKTPPVPLPSSSVLLISPTNQILLLHRVRTASAFSSAHVFPGGAVSPDHDGPMPGVTDISPSLPAYRLAAIRETFEESGILLAKKNGKLFTDISDAEREAGRRAVHAGEMLFPALCRKWGCEPDVDALIPFTRWITPPNVKRRFSTQMYLYFLPLGSSSPGSQRAAVVDMDADVDADADMVIPNPTHDGGIEHTAARFLPPGKWLDLAARSRVILFPPQYFLAWHLARFLAPSVTSASSPIPSAPELQAERDRLRAFLAADDAAFGSAVISPVVLGGAYGESEQLGVGKAKLEKGTAVLDLNHPGEEVEGVVEAGRGISKWVVTTRFRKEGPRDVRVRLREEVFGARERL